MATTKVPGPKTIGVNLDQFDTTTALHDLGEIAFGPNGKIYRYVQFLDSAAYTLGMVCVRGTTGTDVWKVTQVGGAAAVTGNEVVGVLTTGNGVVPTQNQFGWVQVAGECAANGTYAAGDYLIPHASNAGEAVVSGYTAAKANFNIFAHALSSTRIRLTGCN